MRETVINQTFLKENRLRPSDVTSLVNSLNSKPIYGEMADAVALRLDHVQPKVSMDDVVVTYKHFKVDEHLNITAEVTYSKPSIFCEAQTNGFRVRAYRLPNGALTLIAIDVYS